MENRKDHNVIIDVDIVRPQLNMFPRPLDAKPAWSSLFSYLAAWEADDHWVTHPGAWPMV